MGRKVVAKLFLPDGVPAVFEMNGKPAEFPRRDAHRAFLSARMYAMPEGSTIRLGAFVKVGVGSQDVPWVSAGRGYILRDGAWASWADPDHGGVDPFDRTPRVVAAPAPAGKAKRKAPAD